MHPSCIIALVVFAPMMVLAETSWSEEAVEAPEGVSGFQLGGAAVRAVPLSAPSIRGAPAGDIQRLTLPIAKAEPQDLTDVGPATIFLGERLDEGREAVELGTFFERGSTRAGVSVTYLEENAAVAQSEVFLDVALSDRLSVGVSGIFDTETDEDEVVQQLGLNAEFSTANGAFIQGGLASSPDLDPVVGLSIGLRF